MGSIRKNSFTRKILNYLKETSKDLLILGGKIILDPHSLMKGWGVYTDTHKGPYYFSQHLSNLKKSQYFEYKKGKFYLTSIGRIKIIKEIIKERKKKIKWDKKWRAIIFDIPELRRKDRSFLRRELKWIGFKELQKSIWVYPFDIEKELTALLRLWKLDFKGDIRFILIERIEKDKDLRKYFQLS